jgi:hypothetical protein
MSIIKIIAPGTTVPTYTSGNIAVQSNGTILSSAVSAINFINFNVTTSGTNSGAANVSYTAPYDIGIYYPNIITTSGQILASIQFPRIVTFSNNFSPSIATCGNTPTNLTTLSLNKNGSQIGSIVFPASSSTGTITSNSTATTFNVGDVLTVALITSPDTTFSNSSITLAGMR